MNDLLQKHGCANVFTVPEGLKELMADISREVLRDQPPKIFDYIANYLSVLLITREHGILAVRILDDLCDCRPSVSEHLMGIGMAKGEASTLAEIIKEEIVGYEPEEGRERLKEMEILKRILTTVVLDEETTSKVCQVVRNAYRDYWYRKKLLEKKIKVHPDEPWEIAAERTLQLYKSTKPSLTELNRATQTIQAAYRGYHVRRDILSHLKPKTKKKHGPKVDLPGPPIDISDSREIDLGPVIDIRVQVREDNVDDLFGEAGDTLCLAYDPMKTLTHVESQQGATELPESDVKIGDAKSTRFRSSAALSSKSIASKSISSKSVTSKPSVTKSVTSRMDQDINESMDEQALEEEMRKSRTVSIASEDKRSRSVHIASLEGSQQKITFTETPADVIEDTDEILEDITDGTEAEYTGTEGYEVFEDITVQSEVSSVAPSSVPDSDIEAFAEEDIESALEDEEEEINIV